MEFVTRLVVHRAALGLFSKLAKASPPDPKAVSDAAYVAAATLPGLAELEEFAVANGLPLPDRAAYEVVQERLLVIAAACSSTEPNAPARDESARFRLRETGAVPSAPQDHGPRGGGSFPAEGGPTE